MIQVDAQTMREVAIPFNDSRAERQTIIINEVGEVLAETLQAYKINTRLRIAHFLGQTCHESARFGTTEEFASGAAYEGREDLGNTQPGDGPRYKGRGLLQLTGRNNYRLIGDALGEKLEAQPELAAQPALSLKIACQYWKDNNVNAVCDADDVIRVTRLVNGGLNGLDDRRACTSRAKAAIARLEGFETTGEAPPLNGLPVLRRGSKGSAVEELQRRLQALDFMIAIDADFGPATELAVAAFQRQSGLDVDGVVGRNTWAALDALKAGTQRAAAPKKRKGRK